MVNDQWQSPVQAVSERDAVMMRLAITQAKMAEQAGEVPVGAVLAREDEVLGVGYNQPIGANDPTAHAEIVALRDAALLERNYRLPGTTLSTSPWSPVPCVRVHLCTHGLLVW